jgi:hypothetical protein
VGTGVPADAMSEPEGGDQPSLCKDCGGPFTVTEGERVLFASRRLQVPKRCVPCRRARRRVHQTDL